MASVLATLFFKGNRKYAVGSLTLDLLLSESHSRTSEVTEHPIEDGSTISDHIKNDLETGSLTGLISNFSIGQTALLTNRGQKAFDTLNDLWKKRELVKIVTVLKVYEDVAITSLSMDRSDSTGEAMSFSVSFKKVNKVKLQEIQLTTTVKVEDTSTAQNQQAGETANVGKQQGTPL